MGAVGGQIEPYYLSKVMGTSTCDMLVVPRDEMNDKLVKGICGQVDGSIIPGMMDWKQVNLHLAMLMHGLKIIGMALQNFCKLFSDFCGFAEKLRTGNI